jgi:hypothetical protein
MIDCAGCTYFHPGDLMRGENNDSTDFATDTVTGRAGSVKAFRLPQITACPLKKAAFDLRTGFNTDHDF